MHSNKNLKDTLAIMCKVATFLVAVIAYGSNRAWLIQRIGNYYTGYFEGVCSLLIIGYIAIKYGDAINELILRIKSTWANL